MSVWLLIVVIAGAVGIAINLVALWALVQKERIKLRQAKGYADTRKRMDDAPKYLDPDAARDAMRVRKPDTK